MPGPQLRSIVAPSTTEDSERVLIRVASDRQRILALAFVDKGSRIAAWSLPKGSADASDVRARLWDASTGRELPAPPSLALQPSTTSRDGSLYLEFGGPEGGWGAPVRVHDRRTRQRIAALEIDDETNVRCVAFSGDGARVAGGGYGLDCGLLVVWSVISQRKIGSAIADEHIYSVAMSLDGRLVASGNTRGVIELWQAEGGQRISAHRVHDAGVDALTFAADGRIASASNDDGSIRISTLDGTPRDAPATPHPDAIVDVLFSADGTRLVTRSENDTTWLWDTTTGESVRCLHASSGRVLEGGSARDAIFAGSQIVSLAHGGAVWDAVDGATIVPPQEPRVFLSTRVGLSPDGRTVLLVPVRGGDALLGPTLEPKKWRPIARPVRCHAFSADGVWVALGDDAGNAMLMSTQFGSCRQFFHAHGGAVSAIALSGQRCATYGADGAVRNWSFEGEGQAVLAWSLRAKEQVTALGFSEGGRLVTVSPAGEPFSRACTVRSWDPATKSCVDKATGILDWRASLVERPWRALIRDKMFVVESAENGQPIAWTATALQGFTTHPSRPMWAGAVGNQLHWLVLE